mgnify:CR=1 FL=1
MSMTCFTVATDLVEAIKRHPSGGDAVILEGGEPFAREIVAVTKEDKDWLCEITPNVCDPVERMQGLVMRNKERLDFLDKQRDAEDFAAQPIRERELFEAERRACYDLQQVLEARLAYYKSLNA